MFQKRGTFSCQYGLWPDRVESTEWSEEGDPGVEELRKQVQGHLDVMSPTGAMQEERKAELGADTCVPQEACLGAE